MGNSTTGHMVVFVEYKCYATSSEVEKTVKIGFRKLKASDNVLIRK